MTARAVARPPERSKEASSFGIAHISRAPSRGARESTQIEVIDARGRRPWITTTATSTSSYVSTLGST